MSEIKAPPNPDCAVPPGMTRTWYWTVSIWDFLLAWFGSRPYRKLLLGLPAVLLGCAVLGGVIARPFYTLEKKIQHYQSAALKAIDNKQIAVATMCLEKLWELDPANYQTLFAIAYQLNQLEDADAKTVEYLRRLAPEHEPCYAVAHRWMARTLLNSPPEQRAAALPKVKTHLEHADALAKRDADANYLWYLYYGNVGDLVRGAECLAEAAREQPLLAFASMKVQLQLQNLKAAKQWAVQAERYQRESIADGRATIQEHLQQAEVLELLERPVELVELARLVAERFPAADEAPENLRAQTFMRDRLVGQFAALSERENTDVPLMVELTQVLQRIDPLAATQQLDRFSARYGETLFARQFFDRLLREHDDGGALSELLASLAAVRKDYTTAVRLFQLTLQKNPNSAPALNNLAWVLLQSQTDELPRALELVNRALELLPDDASFRETRGQILVKLGRWNEAIGDLKYALNRIPDSKEIHESLAIAYGKSGNDELANLHRQQAQ